MEPPDVCGREVLLHGDVRADPMFRKLRASMESRFATDDPAVRNISSTACHDSSKHCWTTRM
jgi:hypothetical protein